MLIEFKETVGGTAFTRIYNIDLETNEEEARELILEAFQAFLKHILDSVKEKK